MGPALYDCIVLVDATLEVTRETTTADDTDAAEAACFSGIEPS
jgi:hypothetical protein